MDDCTHFQIMVLCKVSTWIMVKIDRNMSVQDVEKEYVLFVHFIGLL